MTFIFHISLKKEFQIHLIYRLGMLRGILPWTAQNRRKVIIAWRSHEYEQIDHLISCNSLQWDVW